jgi:probable rRNA maturation factor
MISVFTRRPVRARVSVRTVRRRAAKLLGLVGRPDAELAIILTGDAEIRALNQAYRQQDIATDVLSFPQSAPGFVPPAGMAFPLGDVVISLETAQRQAEIDGCLPRVHEALGRVSAHPWTILDETTFLLVHGVLHLLGHDHDAPEETGIMERREHLLLTALLTRGGRTA